MEKTITVIGLGNIGLGFSLFLEENGFRVMGIDINHEKIEKINTRRLPSTEPFYEYLLKKSTNFTSSISLEEGVAFSNTIFIFVQTPCSGGDRVYDHSFLSTVLSKINNLKPIDKQIVIGSTVMPKYINEIGNLLLSNCDRTTLSYFSYFLERGNVINGIKKQKEFVIGTTDEILKIKMQSLFTEERIRIVNPTEAEIIHITKNTFQSIKRTFANIIGDLCCVINETTQNEDIREKTVIDAIFENSQITINHFKTGFSVGGPTLPPDMIALKTLLDTYLIHSKMVESTIESNREHIGFQVNELLKEDLSHYLFENVCYNEGKNTGIEESAKLKIAKILALNYGKEVVIRDTEETVADVKNEYGNIFSYEK